MADGLLEISNLDGDTANRLGGERFYAGDFARAESCFLRAVKVKPEDSDAWGNLGLVWQTVGFPEDAARCYQRAFDLNPNNATNLANMGFLHGEEGHEDHAIRFYERALELNPTHARATANLALARLKRFDFERGWPLMEARFRVTPATSIMRAYAWMPWWDGSAVERVAVWGEQGVGDQILYATLIPDLIGRGIDSVWELDPRLISAFRRSFPTGVEFVPQGHDGSAFRGCSAHIAMASLPQFFRFSKEDFSAQPYRLLMPDYKTRRVQSRPDDSDRKRVAFSWRSFKPALDVFVERKKSATISAFAQLADDFDLVDVQYGDVALERSLHLFRRELPDIDLKNDIEGILAVIDDCDCVITTSNVTAHFAGAVGKVCYLIYLRDNPPFYYCAPDEHGHSLWYPSVRIVSAQDWGSAVAAAADLIE